MKDKANVLIVDDDMQVAGSLRDFLLPKEKIGEVTCMPSVDEACNYLKEQEVDLVVLDLILPSSDGYYFLELMTDMGLDKTPDVIVTSALSHDQAIKKAMELGVTYYLLKPYENDILYSRLLYLIDDEPEADVQVGGSSASRSGVNIGQKIMEIFLALGLPPHLKGYRYLREAVKMVLDDPSIIYSITKRLYPEIAKKFGVTSTKVELAIRHTLEVTWQRNNMDNMKNVFGCDVYLKNIKPTNGEFIALVADKLSHDVC